jgi:hypothetical protein
MRDAQFLGVLVLSAWEHDGTVVVRFRVGRGLDGDVDDASAVTGTEAVAAAVRRWLQQVAPPDDEPAQ